MAAIWAELPTDLDLLLSHGPPLGHGDRCMDGNRAGCVDLLRELTTRVSPSACVFGHIHEDPGVTTNGVTAFINATTLDFRYKPVFPPIAFDLPLVPGVLSGGASDCGNVCMQRQAAGSSC